LGEIAQIRQGPSLLIGRVLGSQTETRIEQLGQDDQLARLHALGLDEAIDHFDGRINPEDLDMSKWLDGKDL